MLRLRSCILALILPSPATSLFPSLHRRISAAAPAPAKSRSPRFAVEDYLVDTCGLTPAQALKASTKLRHLKSPTKPNAVLAFLAGLGLSSADIAGAVAKDPKFLCTKVEITLASNVSGLTGLILLHPSKFRCRTIVSKLQYYLPLFSSFENLLRALKHNTHLLGSSVEKFVKPNVAYLRKCGLSACDITKMCNSATWILTINPERLPVTVACAEGLGVPFGSPMFRHALHAVAFLSKEKIAAQVENLKNTLRWSDAEVLHAVSKLPIILRYNNLQSKSEFLLSEVGLEPTFIAHRPTLLTFSLEGRLRPRYYVLKFLKENGSLHHNRDYYNAVVVTEKVFVEKYIYPYKKTAPHLAEDYADACSGQVPTRFRFE